MIIKSLKQATYSPNNFGHLDLDLATTHTLPPQLGDIQI